MQVLLKTFKLVTFILDHQGSQASQYEEIQLKDGLIINKEDDDNGWLIEIFINKQYVDFFKSVKLNQDTLLIYAVISKRNNKPAPLTATVKSITVMNDHISVLFDGYLVNNKKEQAELVLADLVQLGLEGDALLQTFKQKMNEKRSV